MQWGKDASVLSKPHQLKRLISTSKEICMSSLTSLCLLAFPCVLLHGRYYSCSTVKGKHNLLLCLYGMIVDPWAETPLPLIVDLYKKSQPSKCIFKLSIQKSYGFLVCSLLSPKSKDATLNVTYSNIWIFMVFGIIN